MLVVPLAVGALALLEIAWALHSWALSRRASTGWDGPPAFTTITATPSTCRSGTELTPLGPLSTPVGPLSTPVGPRAHIASARSFSSIPLSMPTPLSHHPTQRTVSFQPYATLLAHLLACAAISISFLLPCEDSGPQLTAAAVGLVLSLVDGIALGLLGSVGRWPRRLRRWPFASLAHAWAATSALAWPLGLVWVDGSGGGVAILHLAGVAVWGVAGVLAVSGDTAGHFRSSTGFLGCRDGVKARVLCLAVQLGYSAALAIAGLFVPASGVVQRALLAEVIAPAFLLIHLSLSILHSRAPSSRGEGPPLGGTPEPQIQEQLLHLQRCVTALRAKANCVSTLAHEVRTPLNALLACCTLLGDTALEAGQRELLELILSCGSQIT
eukprot:RCo053274